MIISNRANTILLVAILAVGIAVVAMLATGARGGPLDPPAAPSATGTLPQVEPRMPIPPVGWNGTFPITISQSGSYFLTRNLTVSAGSANGISVVANGVTVDFAGFTLEGGASNVIGIGHDGGPHLDSIVIEHGQVKGFANGIYFFDAYNVHISDMQIVGSTTGIVLPSRSVVDGCSVRSGEEGVVLLGTLDVMRNCHVSEMTGNGVVANSHNIVIENNAIQSNGTDPGTYGIWIVQPDVTVRNNTLDNGTRDIGVLANAAVIIDNVIRCTPSIINLGGYSYYAPVGTEQHANVPRYAPGFC